jgi:hypothetical protein
MFRLASVRNEHFIEIVQIEEAQSAYDSGNVLMSVVVASHGFNGEGEVWVLQEELARFAQAVTGLNQSLHGNAVLRSVSPGELDLELLSVSPRGHLAVQGSIGRHMREQERMHWHSLQFGFEFEPSQLEALVAESWVAKNAA